MTHPKNNFDFLRLLFAVFVVITHSYVLCGTPSDWIYEVTDGQVLFSLLGVKGFFIISGYLIYQSLQRSQSVIDYYWKRLLRLFPALIVVTLLTLVLSYWVYEGPVPFWSNREVWSYFPKNIRLFDPQYNITGVFENNPYKKFINGSLWTIQYEFTMYMALSALFFVRRNKRICLVILSSGFLVSLVITTVFYKEIAQQQFILMVQPFFELAVFFSAGALLACLRVESMKTGKINYWLAISALSILVSIWFQVYLLVYYVALPVLVITLGIKSTKGINEIGKRVGDLSYGLYIYSFPVQQTLLYFFKLNTATLLALSLPISLLLAYLSWHFVESKALKYKNILVTTLSFAIR